MSAVDNRWGETSNNHFIKKQDTEHIHISANSSKNTTKSKVKDSQRTNFIEINIKQSQKKIKKNR